MKSRWNKFLSSKRIGEKHSRVFDINRSEYKRDKDAVIFCDSFRILRRKTQVFSMSRNDFIRDRLTHSYEVSAVGRNLASIVAPHIISKYNLDILVEDFESIIEAACLAHDIGHPPLAHSGEYAIQEYFAHNKDRFSDLGDRYNDFLKYEGNAQNFRILCSLEQPSRKGGLRLTSAVLGAIMKYPRLSHGKTNNGWNFKKHNFMDCDKDLLNKLVKNLGLKSTGNENEYFRSPLVYLVEAADDICYALVDIEDAYSMKEIEFNQAVELMSVLTNNVIKQGNMSKTEYIQKLRAKGIGKLLNEAASIFIEYEEEIVDGKFKGDLLDYVSVSDEFKALKEYASNYIYTSESSIEVRAAGFGIIDKLLDLMIDAGLGYISEEGPTQKQQIMLQFVQDKYKSKFIKTKDHYDCLVGITDFISSLTDNRAIDIYKKFMGASIPTL